MADSTAEKHKKAPSSSPSFFTNFTSSSSSKGFHHETEITTMMSPTSILDTNKPFSGFKNPFWSETNSPRTPGGGGEQKRCYWDKFDSKGVGLGLVDALVDEKQSDAASKQENRTVLFGSQLKIQIPTLSPSELVFSSCSSGQRIFSASELEVMELSEDYTRVISRGTNPRTTHIFCNCIIESVGCSATSAVASASASASASDSASSKVDDDDGDHSLYPSHSFLSFCFYCNKSLGQGKDIYMFRGERAFCSHECRYQGMLLEEGLNKLEADDVYGT